jgi:hypothetical protein
MKHAKVKNPKKIVITWEDGVEIIIFSGGVHLSGL